MRNSVLFPILAAVCLIIADPVWAQATGFDGVYRGEPTSGTGCSLYKPVLHVEKGVARLRFNPVINFEADVGNDGSLEAYVGKNHLTGKFVANHFQGGVATARCQYALDLTK